MLSSLLEKIDQFGTPLPTFNLNEQTELHTVTGGLTTFAIIVIILCYGTLKFYHMITNHNANVASVLETDVFDFNDIMNLNEVGFRFSFSVRDKKFKELKDERKIWSWHVRGKGWFCIYKTATF